MIRRCLDVSDFTPVIKHTLYTNRGLHVYLIKKKKKKKKKKINNQTNEHPINS